MGTEIEVIILTPFLQFGAKFHKGGRGKSLKLAASYCGSLPFVLSTEQKDIVVAYVKDWIEKFWKLEHSLIEECSLNSQLFLFVL